MKIKLCLLIGILYSITTCAYADAIVERRFPQRKSAIQSSTYNFDNKEQTVYSSSFSQPEILELKKNIKQNPTNYILNANLVELYLDTKDYEKAFEELAFLNKLNNQDRLNKNIKTALTNILNKEKNNIKYERNKSLLYANLAMLTLITDDKLQTEKYISQAASINSNSEVIANALKAIFENSQNYSKGIELCNKILQKNPSSYSIRKLKADFLHNNNDIENCIKEYITVIGINQDDNETKYKLYKILESKNISEKEIIQTIYSSTPIKTETALYELSNILIENNEIPQAKYYAEILANNYPNNSSGYMLLSEIYRKEGKLKESYEALSQGKDKVNNNDDVKNYNIQLAKLSNNPIQEARSLYKTGLYEQANDIIKTTNQNELEVILISAAINYKLNNKQIAFDLLNKAMTLYPKEVSVYTGFAALYIEEKDYETARKYLTEAENIQKNNQNIKALFDLANKGDAESYLPQITNAIETQNYKEAIRLTDEALKISNKVPMLYFYKGVTQIAENNYAASTANLYKCIELDKGNYLAYFYLATAFDNLTEHENALHNYKKFVEKLPNDAYEEKEKLNYAKSRINKLQG